MDVLAKFRDDEDDIVLILILRMRMQMPIPFKNMQNKAMNEFDK